MPVLDVSCQKLNAKVGKKQDRLIVVHTLLRGGMFKVVHPRAPSFPWPKRCAKGEAQGTSRGPTEISGSECYNQSFPAKDERLYCTVPALVPQRRMSKY